MVLPPSGSLQTYSTEMVRPAHSRLIYSCSYPYLLDAIENRRGPGNLVPNLVNGWLLDKDICRGCNVAINRQSDRLQAEVEVSVRAFVCGLSLQHGCWILRSRGSQNTIDK